MYWEAACENPVEQERLLKLMLVRVWVEDDNVVRLCLRPNLHITAGLDAKRPTEISVDLDCYQSGSDGARSTACIRPLIFVAKHVAGEYLRDAKAA